MNEKTCDPFVKKILIFLLFFSILSCFSSKNHVFEEKTHIFEEKNKNIFQNNSFKIGEKLKYKISYGKKNKKGGLLLAAYAKLNVTDSIVNNNRAYCIRASGKTTRLFSIFMNVEHSYKSIIDAEKLNTLEFKMKIREGKYLNEEHVVFFADSSLNDLKTNDILGASYRLRTTSHESLKLKDTLFFSYYYNENIYSSYLLNLGEEMIETKFGKIKTIKCAPLLEKGRIFKNETGAFVWVSADQMHIPIKMEIPVLVGSIYVNLSSYHNTFFDFKN